MSTLNICPVIQLPFAESKNSAISAIFPGVPFFLNGCRSALASLFWSVFNNGAARVVSVKDILNSIKQNLYSKMKNTSTLTFPVNGYSHSLVRLSLRRRHQLIITVTRAGE